MFSPVKAEVLDMYASAWEVMFLDKKHIKKKKKLAAQWYELYEGDF